MSSRLTLALLLSGLLLVTCATLFFWNPTLAFFAAIFLVAGALISRFFPFVKTNTGNLPDLPSHAPLPSISNNSVFTFSNAAPGVTRLVGAAAPSVVDETTTSVVENVPVSALLEATMESMREGVLVVDATMRVVASNRAAHEIFGGEERALRSRRLSEVTRHPAIHAAFLAALERGERGDVKIEMLDAEHSVFDLRIAPLQSGASGSREDARGVIGVFFNITRLERLERVRQEFLSNVSHELRTPLTAIITFVETLEEGGIDEPEHNRRFLSVIRRNAERMHILIDDILELSAIEAGTVTVEPAPVSLHALVCDVMTTLAGRAAERRIELRNEVSADAVVYADGRRLEQMLTNLVDNAIKFNHDEGLILVSHERSTRATDRICVSDTGEGIAPEHLARIFERFYRVDRARSRALGGTGLGLAIVKHLARAHGGEASVRSTPHQGSTFTIELPSRPGS